MHLLYFSMLHSSWRPSTGCRYIETWTFVARQPDIPPSLPRTFFNLASPAQCVILALHGFPWIVNRYNEIPNAN